VASFSEHGNEPSVSIKKES